MKNLYCSIFFILIVTESFSQKVDKELLSGFADNACHCIDSISVYDKARQEVAKEISACIDKQMSAYQLGVQLMDLGIVLDKKDKKDKKKKKDATVIEINTNKNSSTYQNYYFELEKHIMDNCKSVKEKIAAEDKQSEKSFSKNPEAMDWYTKGVDAAKEQNFKEAAGYYEKALQVDSVFCFAWDNLGLTYRKLGELDKALIAYKKSITIDSTGLLPWQNVAVVYEYKKDYKNAIEAYNRLALLSKDNPEIYYGVGRIYAVYLADPEKGLDNICKAYNLYTQQRSPYRSDAEQLMGYIYAEMKKQGNEKRFDEILKANNISRD